MKKLIALFVGLAIAVGSANAMCGKKVTATGTLKSYDKASKSITIASPGNSADVTLTPNTEFKDAAGKMAKIEDLVGKPVTVISEHNKADSVQEKKT